jgi:hypothetical protein
MKKITLYLVFFIAIFSASCEDVVQVNLDNAPPKLVIEEKERLEINKK